MYKCDNCNREFTYIGNHWGSSGECGYPSISERQWEILTGFIMGDGCCQRQHSNPDIRTTMSNPEFLQWLDSEITPLSRGFELRYEHEDKKNLYVWSTLCHPEFERFRNWYATGRKRFPSNLTLTPLIAKVWYCCDGSLSNVGEVRFYSENEKDRSEFIKRLFTSQSFSPPMQSGKMFRFRVDESEKLLDWMGEPLPGFEYKWK